MDISLNKAELEKLVEIAIMAEWVMTAHDYEEEDGRRDDYIKLIQKIYAHASKNGMKKEIDFMDDIKEYMPNTDWEDQTQAAEFIREYEEKTFWDELIERLADRDMNRKLGGKKPAVSKNTWRFTKNSRQNTAKNLPKTSSKTSKSSRLPKQSRLQRQNPAKALKQQLIIMQVRPGFARPYCIMIQP